MKHVIAYSQQDNKEAAIADIRAQVGEKCPQLLLFCACENDFAWYTAKLQECYAQAEILGTTTYICFSSLGYARQALAVLAVYEGIECCGGVILDINRYPMKHVDTINACLNRLGGYDNCCCIEMITAASRCEELVLDTFKKVLEPCGIPVIGSSSGAQQAARTFVSFNGAVYAEACVFVLLRNLNGCIRLYSENMFRPTEHYFTATDVDCEERAVYEFNGRPAVQAMAEALNVSVNELPAAFSSYPLGRIVDGQVYITEPDSITAEGALTYFARIYNQTRMVLLEPEDQQAVLERTIARIQKEMPGLSCMLIINCVSRTKMFVRENWFGDFVQTLKLKLGDFWGVSGYGEHMYYELLNQTMVIAAFE